MLIDVQPYDSDVLHLSISTKSYWWRQILSNGGNLFVRLIYLLNFSKDFLLKKKISQEYVHLFIYSRGEIGL